MWDSNSSLPDSRGHFTLNCAGSDKMQLNLDLLRDGFPDSHGTPSYSPASPQPPRILASILLFSHLFLIVPLSIYAPPLPGETDSPL